jgi:hypothetical protein
VDVISQTSVRAVAKKNNTRKVRREKTAMNKSELQTILGFLNIGLAIAHSTGVSVGHFGSTDFIQLAQSVNGLLLNAITPAAAASAQK